MHKIASVFACLACIGYGRLVQASDRIHNSPFAEARKVLKRDSLLLGQDSDQLLFKQLKALASLLLASNSAAGFNPSLRYGFVGVGTMSSAIVRGLCTLPAPPEVVVLSPRGAEKAAALATEFPSICSVAASNQEVVDRSDVVFVGVLPQQTEAVLKALNFEQRHTVVSLVSTAPLEMLQKICAPVPADQVVRAIPLPPVAKHRGATVMTPPHPDIVALFDALGTVVPAATEEQMKKLMTVSALMGQFYAQQRETQYWLEDKGVDAETAAKWTGAVFHCISYDSAKPGPDTFDSLVREQTPGGINEQIISEFDEAGVYDALTDSLDDVLARIEGCPPPPRARLSYSSFVDGDPDKELR